MIVLMMLSKDSLIKSNGDCDSSCDSHEYMASSTECKACSVACDGCTDSGNDNCMSCAGDYKL